MHMQTTILFGNGVNLLKKGTPNWDKILMEISGKKLLPQILDNTLKYEYIILPEDYYCHPILRDCKGNILRTCDKKILRSTDVTEEYVKEKLRKILVGGKTWFYDKLIEMKADFYLTTNYEHYLNELFDERKTVCVSANRSDTLLYTHDIVYNKNKRATIWNIHGSTSNAPFILLGQYEYCNYVVSIKKYLDSKLKKKKISWVNCFFYTDVHIIGFGLGYAETDLWYLLTTRQRMIRERGGINNRIYYYWINNNRKDNGKKKLLRACGVNIVSIPFDKSVDGDVAYEKAYQQIFDEYLKRTK